MITPTPIYRALTLALLLLPTLCLAELLEGKVVGIHDGDSITLLDATKTQYKIRLSGIDAPELGQAFGNRSKERLSRQVFGKSVTVEWTKRDKYNRLVGKILVNGEDANLAQVSNGWAWHYTAYANEQPPADRVAYKLAQDAAQSTRQGLWTEPSPVPPWEHRRTSRKR